MKPTFLEIKRKTNGRALAIAERAQLLVADVFVGGYTQRVITSGMPTLWVSSGSRESLYPCLSYDGGART